MRYELKHDKLAAQIYELASAEAKNRRKAEAIYQMYSEIGVTRSFTEEELEYLGQFQAVLRPKDNLLALIVESKKELGLARRQAEEKEKARLEREKKLVEKNRIRQRGMWGIIVLAGVISAFLLYYAAGQKQLADDNREMAENRIQAAEAIERNLQRKGQLTQALKKEISNYLNLTANTNRQSATNLVTQLNKELPSAYVDPRDWNVYETLVLKDQVWMAENLNFDVGKDSWFYNNAPENGRRYGRLYTWEAAKKACPKGWRLPSDEEWRKIAQLSGGADTDATDGGKLAYQELIVGGNSNLAAQLGGRRYASGVFRDLEGEGYYWSSTELDEDNAWLYSFESVGRILRRYSTSKSFGLSCRCLKE